MRLTAPTNYPHQTGVSEGIEEKKRIEEKRMKGKWNMKGNHYLQGIVQRRMLFSWIEIGSGFRIVMRSIGESSSTEYFRFSLKRIDVNKQPVRGGGGDLHEGKRLISITYSAI